MSDELYLAVSADEAIALEQDNCGDVLRVNTVTEASRDLITQMHWLNIVNTDNYNASKDSATATIPGYFDGGWDKFRESRSTLYQEQQFSSSVEDSWSYLRIELNSGAVPAWRECMQGHKKLTIWVDDVSLDSFTLAIRWDPELAVGEIRDLEVHVSNVVHDAQYRALKRLGKMVQGFPRYFVLTRSEENIQIRGTAAGVGGTGPAKANFSSKFYIPRKEVRPIKPPKCDRGAVWDAVSAGRLVDVQSCVARGWEVAATIDDDGNTALHLAAERHNYDIIKFLMSEGARSDTKNRWGDSPRYICDYRHGAGTDACKLMHG